MKKNCLYLVCTILLTLITNVCVAKSPIHLIQGDPLILLQANKKAIYEVDYSQMIVTDGKEESDMDFYSWMETQDEDNNQWVKDWELKDKKECDKAFRENFNDEVKKGIRLTKLGKDYKVTFRIKKINFSVLALGGMWGQTKAIASGEMTVSDPNTGEILLLLGFDAISGEASYKQISRLKSIFENFGEELNEYLQDYQKSYKKAQKKAAKNK